MEQQQSAILKLEQVDFERISFTFRNQSASGIPQVFLKFENGQNYLQLPRMRTPFGVSQQRDNKGVALDRYTLPLSLGGSPESDKARKFFEALDNFVKEKAWENRNEWFGGKLKKQEQLEFMYTPIVRAKSDKYDPLLTLKVPKTIEGVFQTKAFNANKESIPVDSIKNGFDVTCIISLRSIWFTDKAFGVTCVAQQVKAYAPRKLADYAFDDSDDGEEQVNEAEVQQFDE